MIQVQAFDGLGRFRNDWLNARHHFSFGHYHDPARMGVGDLRVWNDDEIAPGTGFDPHPHRDMEIITYVREGAITHRDSLGNEGRTEAGDVQVMHAGTGIVHAELNAETRPTRLFQIWIMPNRQGVAPGWGTRQFPKNGDGLAVLAIGRTSAARRRRGAGGHRPRRRHGPPHPGTGQPRLPGGGFRLGQRERHASRRPRRGGHIGGKGTGHYRQRRC
jgi:hypothetical protein